MWQGNALSRDPFSLYTSSGEVLVERSESSADGTDVGPGVSCGCTAEWMQSPWPSWGSLWLA